LGGVAAQDLRQCASQKWASYYTHTYLYIYAADFFLVYIYVYVYVYMCIYTYIYIYGGGQLKTKGNEYFKKGEFSEAAVW